jgi:para-nitrobenzyl esterase
MRWARSSVRRALLLLVLAAGCAQAPKGAPGALGGVVWELVRFQGGDGKVLTPAGEKYTLEFVDDGRVRARVACNRGSGGYKTDGTGRIEFGPMAVTRAMCPPGAMDLHDHVLKQLPHVRSYLIRDGRLFLSLMADGGTYEFAPAR